MAPRPRPACLDVTSNLPTRSAHILIDDSCFNDWHAPRLLDEQQTCLVGHFDVEHSTFQLEPASHLQHGARYPLTVVASTSRALRLVHRSM